jgi:IS605 OrfB family transposase
MKLTLQTQLLPDTDQTARLIITIERFNAAADWLAGIAYERKLSNKFVLQRLCYTELRQRFGLPADTAIRCIAQVVEAYKPDKTKRPRFRKHAAVPFSMGKNIGFKGPDRVSISTLTGRVIVPFIMGKYQAEHFGWSKGQCDLVLRGDGKWFLLVTVDVPEGTKVPATDFIGVDLGVERIAVDSDREPKAGEDKGDPGKAVEARRFAYASRRRAIGKKSKGASRKQRRRLHRAARSTERRESRFRRDVNHCISKELVARAKGTGRGIALEDLKGIRDRTWFRKPQRFRLGGWAFHQLRLFLTYKAQLAGVPLEVVDPRDTSRTCSACGHCEKANRKGQALFSCQACGYSCNADFNAARNIRSRARASVNAPQGSERQRAG